MQLQVPASVTMFLRKTELRDTTNNYIVVHNDGNNLNARTTHLTLRIRRLSYHFFISRNGTLYQFMNLKYIAKHAGISKYAGYDNWNDFSIGICLQGTNETPYTEKQYKTLNRLMKYLHARYPDSNNKSILGHSDIAFPYGRKTDPGLFFDRAKIN